MSLLMIGVLATKAFGSPGFVKYKINIEIIIKTGIQICEINQSIL